MEEGKEEEGQELEEEGSRKCKTNQLGPPVILASQIYLV
jgi:hypothetical protein